MEPNIRNLFDLKNEYLDLGYYYYQGFSDYSVPWNYHPRFEIMYVDQGKFSINFRNDNTGEKSETIIVSKGQMLLIDSNLSHSMIVEQSGCRMYNVEFYARPVSESPVTILPMDVCFRENVFVRYMVQSTNKHYYICNDNYQTKLIIQQILSEFDDGGCKSTDENFMLVNLLTMQLFLSFARSYYDYYKSNGSLYVSAVNKYIARNYQSDIRIKDIADSIGINETYMQKFYKAHTGRNITDYLLRYRIAKAKVLMSNTELPLIDIAAEIGFNSRQVFLNSFKKVTGMTPKEYRKNKKIQNHS